ncbi:MAG TPA: hypothetical protein VK756_04960 [Solirubrobacteraceae bacterium]|jgi:hypothetical protein|nr:hypothetical protein [Solirubrobacteraceae bacterium]
MRFPAISAIRATRVWLPALLGCVVFCSAAPVAQASFGVESFFAANCTVSTCSAKSEAAEFFTQAAGHPDYGISDFTLKTKVVVPEALYQPEGVVSNLRVDVPAGLSTNPQAVPQCTVKEFESVEVAPGVFGKSACNEEATKSPGEPLKSTVIGTNYVTVLVEHPEKSGDFIKFPLKGNVYNLVQPEGLPSLFGVAIDLEPLLGKEVFSHTLIEGGVSWNTDYHEYFTIKNLSPQLPLVQSRLVYTGNIGTGGFLTNPSACSGPQTTKFVAESYEHESTSGSYTTAVGASGCNLVPFEPSIAVKPATTQSDQADGATVELKVPQTPSTSEPNSADLNTARVTLAEGMTINPAAAYNLEACTEKQAGLSEEHGERSTGPVTCPAGSKIGTIAIEVPTLPAKSLEGSVYLGSPTGAPIAGPPYTIYFNAESKRYGVAVRQKGLVVPNPVTGQLTATFTENPQAPFSSLSMSLTGGSASGSVPPLANPLACGTAKTESSLIPYTGEAFSKSPFSAFTVDSNGSGGACPSPLPFALTQSTENQSSLAGALTSFKFNLTRPEGQQYLSQAKTVLPAGLLGAIPSVPLCGEVEANAGSCPAASQIGTVGVAVGSGRPYPFTGSVYLTGPYNGAPYGMSIVIPAVAGPFNLGNIVTRAAINVETYTGRVVVTATLPALARGVGLPSSGIPLRLQKLTISVNRQSFLSNPTHCGALATESTLAAFIYPGVNSGTTQALSTPFLVGECSKLAFKPSFSAISGSKTSKTNGASLEVKITQGAKQMNIRQVLFQLPKQLPSRASTLRKACLAATFETGPPPGACKTGRVGTATVTTPDLPGTLTGPAYLVSHGNEAFPDLDLIVKGDGVTIVLVGHTHIANNGVTTSKFETLPDAPVSSAVVTLPVGPESLLAANANLCRSQNQLIAPTTIIGQNGRQVRQKTKIAVRNCPIVVVGHRTSGVKALITVKTPAAGRISGSGTDLNFVTRHVGKASQVTISVPLTGSGAEVLRKFGRLTLKVRVGFVPKSKAGHVNSKAYATVTFRS